MGGGYDIAWNGSAVASNPGGNNPPTEVPQNAIDGTALAKWLDLNFSGGSNVGSSVLVIDNTVNITFDSYYYVTAFDSTTYPERNPISWTLYGSSDGTSWTTLSSVNNATIPNLDQTPTDIFTIAGPTPTPTPTPTSTPTPTASPTPTATPTPTPTPTPTSMPTPTVTPTPTPYPSVCAPVLLDSMYPNIPIGQEYAYATPVYDPNFGLYYKLSCTQEKTSFDYYAIYPPLTIFRSSYSYITYKGFTASYDPNTSIYLNRAGGLDCSEGLLKAIYR